MKVRPVQCGDAELGIQNVWFTLGSETRARHTTTQERRRYLGSPKCCPGGSDRPPGPSIGDQIVRLQLFLAENPGPSGARRTVPKDEIVGLGSQSEWRMNGAGLPGDFSGIASSLTRNRCVSNAV